MQTARAARGAVSDGARPKVGTAAAARSFAEDVSALVRAEVDLAKAELAQSVRPKALGAGLVAGAAALAMVGLLGLVVTVGFVLSEVAGLPGWASALIVSAVLLAGAGVLAAVGRSKLSTSVGGLEVTKASVQEDVAWARDRLKS